MDSTAVGKAPEAEGFSNRKLIRPSLPRPEHNRATEQIMERRERSERPERAGGGMGGGAMGKKTAPPEQTHAENFYYQKQMQARTPMVVVLQDGEEIHGIIEWYDRNCIKVNRNGEPNVLVYKPAIKYMFKEAEIRGK